MFRLRIYQSVLIGILSVLVFAPFGWAQTPAQGGREVIKTALRQGEWVVGKSSNVVAASLRACTAADCELRGMSGALLEKEAWSNRMLLQYRRNAVENTMEHSLVAIVEPNLGVIMSSGFVFEEFSTGKRRLWAALPYHVAGAKGKSVTLRLHGADGTWHVYTTRVSVAGRAGAAGADMSLVLLPQHMSAYVRPLRWANDVPEEGEQTDSFGFDMTEDLSLKHSSTRGRTITKTSFYRFFTKYPLSARGRVGACGSPLLNRGGEVVGMHVGRSEPVQMYALNRRVLDWLLELYAGVDARMPLKVHGVQVGEVKLTESVSYVEVESPVAQRHTFQAVFNGWGKAPGHSSNRRVGVMPETQFTLDHLEQLTDMRSGDRVTVHLTDNAPGNQERVISFEVP